MPVAADETSDCRGGARSVGARHDFKSFVAWCQRSYVGFCTPRAAAASRLHACRAGGSAISEHYRAPPGPARISAAHSFDFLKFMCPGPRDVRVKVVTTVVSDHQGLLCGAQNRYHGPRATSVGTVPVRMPVRRTLYLRAIPAPRTRMHRP